MPLDKCDPCCDTQAMAKSDWTYKPAVLQALCNIYNAINDGELGTDVNVTNGAGAAAVNIQDGGNVITVDGTVTVAAYTAANLTQALTAVTGSGTVAANAYRVSIANVGSAAGTVKTVAFPAGAVIEFNAFVDPVSQSVKRCASVAYDATGTTFNIVVES